MRFCFDQKDFVEKDIQADKHAVVGVDVELSWQTFSEKVDELCRTFEARGWDQAATPVIIYGHKSAYMLVAIYAMMKLEVPYIPLDKAYPIERIKKIKSIAESQLVINTDETPLHLEGTNEIHLLEDQVTVFDPISIDLRTEKSDDPLVYIIFTSGSTGEPKGVQISTEAVQSFTRWMSNDFGFSAQDTFVNTAILSFDLSVFEVMTFGALGGTLLLNSKEQTSDPAQLISRVETYQGSIWVSTPSFALLYARMKEERRLDCIRYFLFCGEVLPHDLSQQLIRHYPKAKIYNTYGPTEATVATTLVEITQDILDKYPSLPVGRSKRESELIIDDGEIIIVGPNVSKGYVKQEELNAQKFHTLNGQRAFRTGDHGTLDDGMLFFAGRKDDLVKLHGYRIELNEISSALRQLKEVINAETIALERNGSVKKIVSFVQLGDDVELDVQGFKSAISEVLPHYMVPSDIRSLSEIPLNQNGKADKKQLTALYLKR